MSRSLFTGVSGLTAHQQQLDVVASNLANINTNGYKTQRTTFRDLVSNTIQAGSGPVGSSGGVNPQQIGTGVEIGQIQRSFTQGALTSTGEELDFAIQGEGFFIVNNPSGDQLYTRAGSFALDLEGNLVDPASGFLVQRTSSVGEATDTEFGFQEAGDNRINIPLGAPVPALPTQNVSIGGNLNSDSNPPLNEVLSSVQNFQTSTGEASATTLLDDLTLNSVAYQAGDQIELSGTQPDGTPFSTSINAQGATVQDLIDGINGVLVGATATLTSGGAIQITADDTGDSFTSLIIEDAAGNVGQSNFLSNPFIVSTEGTNGDIFNFSAEIIDGRGFSQRINLEFRKVTDNEFELTASLEGNAGQIVNSQVQNILFNEDGTFQAAGTNTPNGTQIEFDFDSISENQVIELSFDDLNHIAQDFSISQTQDGTPAGTLVSISVSGTGEITGSASNGRSIPLAQLAIATFSNTSGLEALGSNFFGQSLNSGEPSIGAGLSGGRGQLIGGQLERSNVDIAQEFTQLIVAQRGFSANARTITVADEVLEELTNIIR